MDGGANQARGPNAREGQRHRPVLKPLPASHGPGSDWLATVLRPSLESFAAAFTDTPVLVASVIPGPLVGAASIRAFFRATQGMYGAFAFTGETASERRTFLEWMGCYRGAPVGGVTILDKDALGRVERIRLFHLPLNQVTAFAAELAALLASRSDQTGDSRCA